MGYSTRNCYKGILNKHVLPQIGMMRLRDVRMVDVQKVMNSLQGMSRSTISTANSTLGQLFKTAVQNQLIPINPATELTVPAGTKGTHRALTRDEIALLAQNWQRHRSGIWAMIMLFSGLRRGEALALTWADVDLLDNVIDVNKAVQFESNRPKIGPTKTRSSIRKIPLAPLLRNALIDYKAQSNNDLLCVSANNDLLSERGFDRGWDGLLLAMTRITNGLPAEISPGKKIKLPEGSTMVDWKSHDMRHTFATMLFDAGVDVKTAQAYLGHETVDITMGIYTHLSEQKEMQSRALFDSYMNPQNLLG